MFVEGLAINEHFYHKISIYIFELSQHNNIRACENRVLNNIDILRIGVYYV